MENEKVVKRQYTITDFLNDKIKREEEIQDLYAEKERLEEEIKDKEEKYRFFVNGYLYKNGLQIKNFEED